MHVYEPCVYCARRSCEWDSYDAEYGIELNQERDGQDCSMASVMQGHMVSVQLECTCATHSGIYACSSTNRRTVMMCMMSFSMKSVGMAMMAIMGAMKGKC